MSRFNLTVKPTATSNRAGGHAYALDDKAALTILAFCSHIKDEFYRSADDTVKELQALASRVEPKFVANLALYTRHEVGNRSVTHLLAGEVSKRVKGETWTKDFFRNIVRRPDDMLEIVGYIGGEKKLPNAMKKGFAQALQGFSEYQLAKYKAKGKSLNLYDLVNITHPNPTSAITKLMNGTLKAADTWETAVSAAGSDAEKKKDAWKELVMEKKLKPLALLRNINNIVAVADDKMIDELCRQLAAVDKDVFPFQFFTALKNITTQDRRVLKALSEGCDASLANVPELAGKTLIALDKSGSMNGRPLELAIPMASALFKKSNADLVLFDDHRSDIRLLPTDSTIGIMQQIANVAGQRQGGTNFEAILSGISKAYDNIIVLSDMQGWAEQAPMHQSYNQYKARSGANPNLFMFDTNGLGTLKFAQRDVFLLGGVSDKVFDVLNYINKRDSIVKLVEDYTYHPKGKTVVFGIDKAAGSDETVVVAKKTSKTTKNAKRKSTPKKKAGTRKKA